MTTIISGNDANNEHRAGVSMLKNLSSPSENWDDDFEFHAGTDAQTREDEDDAMNAPRRPAHSDEHEESWDDAYVDDDAHASPIKRAPKVDDDDVEDWDSSDNEHDEHRDDTRRLHACEIGLGEFEEEDKTVTARSTLSRPREAPPALPLPVPASAFPFQTHSVLPPSTVSPTISSFSIPLSSTTRDHASIYSQEPLVRGSSSSAPHLSVMRSYPHGAGSTPPRKGRRLRKKSRPPEADIFELEDRELDTGPPPLPPLVTLLVPEPPQSTTPPRTGHVTIESPSHSTQTTVPPPSSPSLLTRIGSFKRWARRSMGPEDPAFSGWRRSKSSIGPSDVKMSHGPGDLAVHRGKASTGPENLSLEEEPSQRAISPTLASGRSGRSRGNSASGQKSGWFFRAGGAERDEVKPILRTPEASPRKQGTAVGLRIKTKDQADDAGVAEKQGLTPTPRKGKGKLVPVLKGSTTPTAPSKRPSSRDGLTSQPNRGQRPTSMLFPRNGAASVGRHAGLPFVTSITEGGMRSKFTPGQHENGNTFDGEEKEGGMRSIMNGVRRLSLVGAGKGHKRTKSTSGDTSSPASPVKKDTGRPRSRTEHHVTHHLKRPTSQASVGRPRMDQGEGVGLLPPLELDGPLAAQYGRRGSLPWADYDPSVGADSPAEASGSRPQSGAAPQQQLENARQSFSTSTSSLLNRSPSKSSSSSSPSKHLRSVTSPIPVPALPADIARTRTHSPNDVEQRHETYPQPARTGPPSSFPPVSSQAQALSQAAVSPPPHSASLGRSVTSSPHPVGLRRNSLGDLKVLNNSLGDHKASLPTLGELKIPARISRAQQGLRRDMSMVREFASCVEKLKRLQSTYTTLLEDLRTAYEASPASFPSPGAQPPRNLSSRPPSHAGTTRTPFTLNPNSSVHSIQQTLSLNSPTKLHTTRSFSRVSHDMNRELTRLEHEYGIWWECAELLIELGSGTGGTGITASNPNLATHSSTTLATPGEDLSPREQQPIFLRQASHVSSLSEPGSIFEQSLPISANTKGPPQASPPHPTQWRASTGRHDLSARQLRLLKDMLNTPDPASLAFAAGPYGYGSGYPHPYTGLDVPPWAVWNPSTVTLPSEESSVEAHGRGIGVTNTGRNENKDKKRRGSTLGMLGLREILRGLKRSAVAEGRLPPSNDPTPVTQRSSSSMSSSVEDDYYNRRRSPWHQHDPHHAAKLSTSPESMVAPPARNPPPKSPRRPSLASIFRLGQKGTKNAGANGKNKDAASPINGTSSNNDNAEPNGIVREYSDWHRMSRSDLDLGTIGSGTIRGKKIPKPSASHSNTSPQHPYQNHNAATPKKTAATSQTSLWESSPPSATSAQPSRLPLTIAEETGGRRAHNTKTVTSTKLQKERTSSWSQAHPPRPTSRNGKSVMSGTVRSAPPTDLSSPDPKLALTPENIKPLLEYAREVSTRLTDCIGEVETLLGANGSAKVV